MMQPRVSAALVSSWGTTMDYFTISYDLLQKQGVTASIDTAIYFPDLDDHILNVIRTSGKFYETDLLEHMYQSIHRKGIYIDVGANIGNHTVFFAKFMAAHVVSIEPQLQNYQLLTGTVAKNGLRNVTCVRCAVGSKAGVGCLVLPKGYERNRGAFSLIGSANVVGAESVSVDTLDSLIGNLPNLESQHVTAVKIDVEGAEVAVLEGAGEILTRYRPHVIVEAQSEERLSSVSARLLPLGYRLIGCFCATPTYHFAPWSYLQWTWFRVCRKAQSARSRKDCRASGK